MSSFLDVILHLDQALRTLATDFGPWTLAILAAVIFCETGLVFFPFLPGDSLLFAAGSLAAIDQETLPVERVLIVLILAACIGDAVNFEVGRRVGAPLKAWIERRPGGGAHIQRAERFFEEHGGKAIVLARFLPFLRTFVPFVAGLANMQKRRFFLFNVFGGTVWVTSFVIAGYLFGNLPIVQKHLHFVVLAIIVISVAPIVVEVIKARRAAQS